MLSKLKGEPSLVKIYSATSLNSPSMKKGGHYDDVMKTPAIKVVSALRFCNPPAFQLYRITIMWPAMSKRSNLCFQSNLMSIPIESKHPPQSCISFSAANIRFYHQITKKCPAF